MNNFDELYFTVKTNDNYIHKGSFNYKSGEIKKNGDISCSYNKMTFVDNKIQISYCEDIAYNVENKGNVSYSAKTNETVLGLYTFDELVNSEYWNSIIKKYKFDEKAFKRYEENYISEDKENININYSWDGVYLDIRLNKIDGEIVMRSNINGVDYYGSIYDLRIINDEDCEALQRKAKIVDLMENHKVQVLENGYVVDNVYYEDIDDYKEET